MSYMPARHQGPAHRDEPLPPTDDPLNGPLARPAAAAPAPTPAAESAPEPPAAAPARRPEQAERPSWAEQPAPEPDVPRFMSATDFLERRAEHEGYGPPTWGWRGRLHRWTGGTVSPRMGADEMQYARDRAAIQRAFDGPRTIAFLNPKGGAAKTTSVLVAGYTFGTVRGGGVVAWDNNETRGTLGIRGQRAGHGNTTRELLEDLERFNDVYQARIGDLGAFVRSQRDAHFDVLASDERPESPA